MKALILAAGFGTRLRPLTENLPKPLFPVAGRPLLDIIVRRLENAGCRAVIINTHHLHRKIESFVLSQNYSIPVSTRYEPEILGTGGAIKNVADFWDDTPFMVVNSDIVTDIDLKTVYDYHLRHGHPATMVLCDDPEFNSVAVDPEGFVTDIHESAGAAVANGPCRSFEQSETGADDNSFKHRTLTFTGIQVLDPGILDLIPANTFSSSIDVYRKLSAQRKLKAFVAANRFWQDIGTPQRYTQAVYRVMAPEAFRRAFPGHLPLPVARTQLKGDGSDRKWFRLSSGPRTMILADHGIRTDGRAGEADAFVAIGRHLLECNVPVPRIYHHDLFSGLVFMEDLGDVNLHAVVRQSKNDKDIVSIYRRVVDLLIRQSAAGKTFDTAWTCQTATYSRNLILEKECRYFVEAFLNGYLGKKTRFEDFENDFWFLAENAVVNSVDGFMHRDFQSRNIMVKNGRLFFIDFQGGRLGPIQYDLASLLIDPYVELPFPLQEQLLEECFEKLSAIRPVDPQTFFKGYRFCAVTRNLQALGAFGFLSRVKKKPFFETFIPPAVRALKHNLKMLQHPELNKLARMVEKL